MNEKLPILNVHMLGDFSVMYGTNQYHLERTQPQRQ